MMLNSGVSLIMRDIQSKEIASVSLNTLWPVDPNHDFKQIDPLEWLNVAAEVAQEDFEHHDDVICAWRFLQVIYARQELLMIHSASPTV